MIEQAKEELRRLETEHPNRFDYLKVELMSFIFLLEQSHNMNMAASSLADSDSISTPACCSTATTQGSSTTSKKEKRKKGVERSVEVLMEAKKQKVMRIDVDGDGDNMKERDWRRIDAAIERAKLCLHKIQLFKTGC